MLNLTAFSVNAQGQPVCRALAPNPAALPEALSRAGVLAPIPDRGADAPCRGVADAANRKTVSLGAALA